MDGTNIEEAPLPGQFLLFDGDQKGVLQHHTQPIQRQQHLEHEQHVPGGSINGTRPLLLKTS